MEQGTIWGFCKTEAHHPFTLCYGKIQHLQILCSLLFAESSCGFLDTPSNGSIALSEDGLTATFECQEGYTMNGGSESVCRDAVWSNGAPTCTGEYYLPPRAYTLCVVVPVTSIQRGIISVNQSLWRENVYRLELQDNESMLLSYWLRLHVYSYLFH